jgi:hypothetical protein
MGLQRGWRFRSFRALPRTRIRFQGRCPWLSHCGPLGLSINRGKILCRHIAIRAALACLLKLLAESDGVVALKEDCCAVGDPGEQVGEAVAVGFDFDNGRTIGVSGAVQSLTSFGGSDSYWSERGQNPTQSDGVHIWKEKERSELRAELDAAYFHLYGVGREDAEYMLSTFTNTGLIPEEERGAISGEGGRLFQSGSTGAMVLNAYDQLSPLIAK